MIVPVFQFQAFSRRVINENTLLNNAVQRQPCTLGELGYRFPLVIIESGELWTLHSADQIESDGFCKRHETWRKLLKARTELRTKPTHQTKTKINSHKNASTAFDALNREWRQALTVMNHATPFTEELIRHKNLTTTIIQSMDIGRESCDLELPS